MAVTSSTWSPSSWRERPALQQPEWPDEARATAAVEKLRASPPLVFAGEARALRESLANVLEGRAFLLQAGDCVESFNELSTMRIREKLKIMLQMSAVLTYGATLPVVKVGRIAGQFTKPRSEPLERETGLPSFRGHMVHGDAPTAEARIPDPQRMVEGYNQSAQTLNLLRAFTKGGYADLTQVQLWNQEFVASSPEGRRYELLASEIERALRFMAACGIDLAAERRLHEVDVFTSHEGLLLEYEEGLTRRDSLTNDWYDCSAHLLWIGERTRQLDGAHVEFFSGVHNPLAVKLGPSTTADEAIALCERLNPGRVPGRLTFVARMGAQRVLRHQLPGDLARKPGFDSAHHVSLREFFGLEHRIGGELPRFACKVGMFGVGLRTDRNIFSRGHRHGAGDQPGHTGKQNIALGSGGRRHAEDQAGGRYDSVIGAKHCRPQPSDP